jgi:hypothetical protein
MEDEEKIFHTMVTHTQKNKSKCDCESCVEVLKVVRSLTDGLRKALPHHQTMLDRIIADGDSLRVDEHFILAGAVAAPVNIIVFKRCEKCANTKDCMKGKCEQFIVPMDALPAIQSATSFLSLYDRCIFGFESAGSLADSACRDVRVIRSFLMMRCISFGESFERPLKRHHPF